MASKAIAKNEINYNSLQPHQSAVFENATAAEQEELIKHRQVETLQPDESHKSPDVPSTSSTTSPCKEPECEKPQEAEPFTSRMILQNRSLGSLQLAHASLSFETPNGPCSLCTLFQLDQPGNAEVM